MRDAARAAFAEGGSLRTKAQRVLPSPGPEKPGSPARALRAGRQREARRWRRARRARDLLFISPLLSPWVGPGDRGGPQDWNPAKSWLRSAPLTLRADPHLPEARLGSPGPRFGARSPSSRMGAQSRCSRAAGAQQPQPRPLQPWLFHPELPVKPAERLWFRAPVQRLPGASRPKDAGTSPGRGGARGLGNQPRGCCSLSRRGPEVGARALLPGSQTPSAPLQRAERPAPYWPPPRSQK